MTARLISPRLPSLALPATTRPDGVPSLRWPSQVGLLRRLVCGHCGAAVIVDDAPSASSPLVDLACQMCSRTVCELRHDQMRSPTTPEQFRELPAAHGKRGPKAQDDVLCPDCRTTMIRPASARCRNCAAKHREGQALKHRVVALLETGQAFSIPDLVARFRVDDLAIRHAIQGARRDGRRIVRQAGLYRLEVAP